MNGRQDAYSQMDVHRLVDMYSDEVIESRASSGSKGGIRLGRLGDEALHGFNVLATLVLAQRAPAEELH